MQSIVQKASVAPTLNKHKPSNTAAIEALDVLAEQGAESTPAAPQPTVVA